jgi:alkylation response protein AidB-like acyl-CoA dehydrogenase
MKKKPFQNQSLIGEEVAESELPGADHLAIEIGRKAAPSIYGYGPDRMSTGTDIYSIPQDLLDFRETIGQIARERIAPRAAEIDEKSEYPKDVRELLAEHDILALPFEEQYGGTGTGTLMLQMAVEEIAKACASSALILMVQELGSLPIRLFGSDELKQRVLPRCASGEWTPAFALSEPEAGSDPGAMRTHAELDGDEWVINGAKNWISNAGVADFYVVFAVTDREKRRITAFMVEADRPGFSIGNLEHKLGIRGSPTGSPVLEDVRVPAENVIGEVGRGLGVALGTLERTRLGAAAQAVGIAQAQPTTRTRTPRSASRSASRSTNSRGSRSSSPTWRPARRPPASCCTRRARSSTVARPGVGKYTSMANLFASDNAMRVTVEAVPVLGGYGYVNDYPLERMMRDAKITQIYEGTNEIQRLVIARAMAR